MKRLMRDATMVLATTLLAILTAAVSAYAASPAWKVTGVTGPTHLPPGGSGQILVNVANIGGAESNAPLTLTIGPLPAGIQTSGSASGVGPYGFWSCPGGAGQTTVTCTLSTLVRVGGVPPRVSVPVSIGPSASASSSVPIAVSGGGALLEGNDEDTIRVTVSSVPAAPGLEAVWAGAFDADGRPFTQAGGHPAGAGVFFRLNTVVSPRGQVVAAGDLRELGVEVPPGFIGNPLATPARCPQSQRSRQELFPGFYLPGTEACPGTAFVGRAEPQVQSFEANDGSGNQPIFNNEPAPGFPAQFTFPYVTSELALVGSLRSDDDYGVTVTAPNVPLVYKAFGSYSMLTGRPAGSVPFLTNPTSCTGDPLPTTIRASTWQAPDVFDSESDESPPVTGCELVPFDPSVSIRPTSSEADSASGLDVDFDVPQDGLLDPDELATSHLKKTVVTLPEGVSVNPSGATGLAGCSDTQFGVRGYGFDDPAPVRFTDDDPFDGEGQECPDASKIGTVEVTTPLLEEPLTGDVVLGSPKSTDPASGQMFRLFLVVRNEERGVLVKIHGTSTADPATGRLRATFDNNPQVPFDKLRLKLKGGPRGILATPAGCGTTATASALTPWSRAHLPADQQDPVEQDSDWITDGDCAAGFDPSLSAGMDNTQARASGTFSFQFSRPQGDQALRGLTARLPQGLLASVKDVPLCSNAAADAGACPAASKIGIVDAKAGAGDPFVLEQKGEVFLTEGYKGGEYGLAVKIRPIAGPFRGEWELSPILVRQAIHVDRSTAQVTAISDPLPLIHHGVPLRVREVNVLVNRGGFMLNPSDCDPKQVGASLVSTGGATANPSNPFQVSGCAGLPFKPKLSLALTGRKQVTTGKHPGIKATVTQQGTSEAGIEKTVVRLPKSLALDPNNAQALCEFVDGTKPDLENHCPKGSIVGRARAKTPLLEDDLVGNVYFVKNVRVDPKTGNQIRTLPMIIVALRGEIAINLKGESSTTNDGRLVNTFASVPDAPISQFNLNIKGGGNGIIAVTRTRKAKINLCAGRHIAETDMDGQNGRRHDFDVRMKTPCTRKQTKNAKRAAKRATKQAARRR